MTVEPESLGSRGRAAGEAVSDAPPRLESGEAIRFRDPHADVRYLWPADESVGHPYVSVLVGFDGTQYPLVLDGETVARACRGSYDVVSAATIPVEPPSHARTDGA
ncbi:hypothetical protein [Halovivax gelatinilyticus]|uniref:hypothetical protein n=1 Tax=Halovivax gelatinilyticus TaxID=2961597 RepID=UPI0020CA76E3|nr:hypothetical protein [Halovivax gelatinilyticus]